jgi:ferredoxin-NADP reductase
MLMLAAGAGIGPMMSMLPDQEWAPGEAILVQREDQDDFAMMTSDIQNLVETRGLKWVKIIGHAAKSGSRWLPADENGQPQDGPAYLRELLGGDVEGYDVFLCGPPPWLKGVAADLETAGVPVDHIHAELFEF